MNEKPQEPDEPGSPAPRVGPGAHWDQIRAQRAREEADGTSERMRQRQAAGPTMIHLEHSPVENLTANDNTMLVGSHNTYSTVWRPSPNQGWRAWVIPTVTGAVGALIAGLAVAYAAHRFGWV